MFLPFLGPLAHFAFDNSRVDAVTTVWQDFLGDFLQQIFVPPSQATATAWALGQSATQNFQGACERQASRWQLLRRRRLDHQCPYDEMG